MSIMALIVAAGIGSRCKTSIPKQYCNLGNTTILEKAITTFTSHKEISKVQVVINQDHRHLYNLDPHPKLSPPIFGGEHRQDSVFNGLIALQEHKPEFVLIHDGARPFTSHALISRVIQQLQSNKAVLPTLKPNESLIEVDSQEVFSKYLYRNNCRIIQTPQGFDFKSIIKCFNMEKENSNQHFTDEGSLAHKHGIAITTVPGEPHNTKITLKEDIDVYY